MRLPSDERIVESSQGRHLAASKAKNQSTLATPVIHGLKSVDFDSELMPFEYEQAETQPDIRSADEDSEHAIEANAAQYNSSHLVRVSVGSNAKDKSPAQNVPNQFNLNLNNGYLANQKSRAKVVSMAATNKKNIAQQQY